MNSRTDAFLRKFTDALVYLGGSSVHDLASIKYRDNVNNVEYREFIEEYLRGELGLDTEQVQGDFQGRAWLVADRAQNKVLLVEHETGLEVLYIAGSIASLISLVPLINSGWKFMQSRFSGRPFLRHRGEEVEIRTIGSRDQLLEQHILSVESYAISESIKEITALKLRVETLEHELKEVKEKKAQKSVRKKPAASPRKAKK
jgi:hypothetical protein